MDLALAGAGAASVVHALAASAVGAPIIAVASRDEARAAERAAQVGARAVPFAALPAGADAVIVCTPPAHHRVEAVRALDAGCTVLVERPLATTLLDADELVARGDRVVYGENLLHSPVVTATRTLAATLGAIEFVEVRLLSPLPTWGDHLDPARGGGVLLEMGPSAVALAVVLLGERPTTVTASVESSDGLEVDDRAVLRLGFPSGADARIEVDWRASGTVWDVQASSATGVVRADLAPTPALEHDGEPMALPTRRTDVEPHVEWLGHLDQLRHLEAVVAGARPVVDAELGRLVLEIVCAAYASAHDDATVSLPFVGRRDITPIDHWRGTRT